MVSGTTQCVDRNLASYEYHSESTSCPSFLREARGGQSLVLLQILLADFGKWSTLRESMITLREK